MVSPDPLSPTSVSLVNSGKNNSLKASWETPAGEREFYLVTLQEGKNSTPLRNVTVAAHSTHHVFRGLTPGTRYIAWVTAVAGPHRASTQSVSAWTCKLGLSVSRRAWLALKLVTGWGRRASEWCLKDGHAGWVLTVWALWKKDPGCLQVKILVLLSSRGKNFLHPNHLEV